jgi:hypothetical protein
VRHNPFLAKIEHPIYNVEVWYEALPFLNYVW